MPTYLDEIVAAHREAARLDRRPADELMAQALASPSPREDDRAGRVSAGSPDRPTFAEAVAGGGGLSVVAEIKRRSPSKGPLDPGLDPAEVAGVYAGGGAAALSVLTDERFFGGAPDDLRAARAATALPVLRKDFTVGPADVCDTRLMGADAVLLIVAALAREELAELLALAARLDVDALVEVHDEAELEAALAAGSRLVGVNQRDLRTFEVDGERARRLAAAIPPEVVAVAESGIAGPEEAAGLAAVGYQAVLVGESLVRAADRRAAVVTLAGHPVSLRPGALREAAPR